MAKKPRDALAQLEAQKRQAGALRIRPQQVKPCVAAMLEHGPPGGELDRNTTAYIIATELRAIGYTAEDAEGRLAEWAMATAQTGRAVHYAEIKKTVRSAYRGEPKTFGCAPDGKLYRSGLCLGHDACPYYRALGGKRQAREADFYEFGWPAIVGSSAAAVYTAIVSLEHRRGVVGGTTFASYADLHWRSGLTKGAMKRALEKLQVAGLIEFTAGKPRDRERGQATEIRRKLPIPEPRPEQRP